MSDLLLLIMWFITTVGLCFRICYDECKMIELEFKLKEIEENEKNSSNVSKAQ